MDPGDVEYEPVSVKVVLVEMKDTAELLIDLAYSAVLHGSDEVAAEVLELEERMDVLQLQARMSLLMAARSTEDAERLAPVLGVVGAAEKISDAAGDIAKVVLEDIGVPEAMRAAIPEAVETVVRGRVAPDSDYAGTSLGGCNLETDTGVRVIAIRRAGDWIVNPDRDTALSADDVVLLRGTERAIGPVYETVTGDAYDPPAPVDSTIDDLDRAVDSIVLMKNMSELAVDLAYGSVLFDSQGVAAEVVELEAEVDALKSRFEAWVLRAAGRVEDPISLRGLVHLASATEVISDAALEISEGVLRGLDTHPVVAAAVEESDEVIVRVGVGADGRLADASLGDLEVKTATGMRVIAVRRGGGDWVVSPGPETVVHPGDVLIAKGTRAGADRLADLAGDA
ncbi:potassium channel family protein [Haloplanus rallus]|uniref:Potassium channel family protein n=1 Tax=Haloplanus rallus TaxID=1816183 RepID=A0A6B9F4S6_9EURY|nr:MULTISPECIES: potassium channel family protein [Haloplanus]QGX95338.1 potassium channel family protein [Haloplanus rallus]